MRLSIVIIVCLTLSGCTNKSGPILAGGKPVDHWVRALSDPDAKLRKKAAEKLGNVGAGDPQIVAALCGALRDKNADVRREAILALAKAIPSSREAIDPLKAVGRLDPNPQVRSYAARALEKLESGGVK